MSPVLGVIRPSELAVFIVLFCLVSIIGLLSVRWRRGDVGNLEEWGIAGRRFGGFVTWFLQGGSIYTTYSFIAVPALVFGKGIIGFYALPYLVIAYVVMFLVMPQLWTRARDSHHVTAADFVKERFESRWLAVVVAFTGIVAMVPYVALQIYGIEICLSEIGIPIEVSLVIATTVLALITYVSGLRAAALIAIAKDVLIWTTVFVAVIYIPLRLGGYGHIFSSLSRSETTLKPSEYLSFSTLALGSGLALYLYPHTFTGSLSATSPRVLRFNAATLPVYTIMLGMLALLGYMGVAAGISPDHHYGANIVVPALFQKIFPPWFAGVALAAISIGALVPASVMSIAAGSLFGRNIYSELRLALAGRGDQTHTRPPTPGRSSPGRGTAGEARASKLASFTIKFLGVAFILTVPATFVINFQLAGGVWIVQTLAAVFLAPFVSWLDRRAVLAGWAVGMGWGTYLLVANHFASSTVDLSAFGHTASLYIGVPTAFANLLVAFGGSGLALAAKASRRGRSRPRTPETVLVGGGPPDLTPVVAPTSSPDSPAR